MASLIQRNGMWYVQYRAGDKSYQRKSLGTSLKSEAKALMTQYTNLEMNTKHKAPLRKVSSDLSDALVQFRDTILPSDGKAINSITREQSVINILMAWTEEHNIHKVDKLDVKSFIETRKKQGWKPKTLREDLRVIRNFVRWATKVGMLHDDPTTDIELPPIAKSLPRFLTKDEIDKLLKAVEGNYKDIFKFILNTGARSGEVSNMEWSHWIPEKAAIIIPVKDGDRATRTCGNKTKRETVIYLNPIATSILERKKNQLPQHEYIFTNESGNKLDNDNCYRAMCRACKNAKIGPFRVHDMRHTYGSTLAQKGIPLLTIRDLMRHDDIGATQIYAHLSDSVLREAADSLRIDEKPEHREGKTINMSDFLKDVRI